MYRASPLMLATLLFARLRCHEAAVTRRSGHLRAASHGVCISDGDMCVEPASVPSLLAAEPWPQLKLDTESACPSTLPDQSKLMVMPIVPMYHGSTALESIFMSSPKITTLCSAGTWQCEARLDFDGIAHTICNLDSCVDLFSRYVNYWNMSQPILFEKGPRGMHAKVVREYTEMQKERDENPAFFKEHGIADLKLAYVMMWRPVCLSLLSSHARQDARQNATAFALAELTWLEDLVESHKFLTENGVNVLVTNLADMMWRVKASKQRLEEFVPCVGDLDFDYVPKLNKDYFPDNEWKADGSVADFGRSVHPEKCCGYDVAQAKCTGSEGQFFDVLQGDLLDRAEKAVEYLQSRSGAR